MSLSLYVLQMDQQHYDLRYSRELIENRTKAIFQTRFTLAYFAAGVWIPLRFSYKIELRTWSAKTSSSIPLSFPDHSPSDCTSSASSLAACCIIPSVRGSLTQNRFLNVHTREERPLSARLALTPTGLGAYQRERGGSLTGGGEKERS